MSTPAVLWYFKNGEQVSGPYQPEQLKQAVAQGVITAATQVRQGENGQWYTAWEVPGLLPKNTDAGQVAATTFNAAKSFAENSAWKTSVFRIAQLLVVIGEVIFILTLLFNKDTIYFMKMAENPLWTFIQVTAASVVTAAVFIAVLETAINTGKMVDYLRK